VSTTTGTGTGGRSRTYTAPRPGPESFDGGVPPLGPAIAFLRRLRQGIERGPVAVPGAAAGALGSFPREVRDAIDRTLQRAAGDYDEDDWGFDEEFAIGLRPLLDFSDDFTRLLRHGRATDTTRLVEEVGYQPRYTTAEAVEDYLRTQDGRRVLPNLRQAVTP